jgi:hypothetical protein
MSTWPRNATVRPLPMPVAYRPRSYAPFRAGWSATLQLLNKELDALDAKQIVLQLDVTEGQLRIDGMPRADAKPASPAVAIAFDSSQGPLRYACDEFSDWRDNVRAIALGLEALRKVERYGIAKSGEQYKGYLALPATPSGESARRRLAEYAGLGTADHPLDVRLAVQDIYREAMRRTHPDRGGDADAFNEVQRIWKSIQNGAS